MLPQPVNMMLLMPEINIKEEEKKRTNLLVGIHVSEAARLAALGSDVADFLSGPCLV